MSSDNRTAESGIGRTAAVLVPGGLLALLSTTVVGVAVPDVVADTGTSVASAQWVATAYLLAAGAGIAASGWASARHGVRRTWLVALAIFAAGALGSALAPGIVSLNAARAVQGLGGGALEPIMLTALARAAGPQRMGRVMGTVAAVMSIGPLAGPALGGIVVDGFGWRATFGATALLAAVVAAASWRVLARDAGRPAQLDLPGLLLVTSGTTLGLLGTARAATPAGFDALALAEVTAAVAVLAVFVWWSLRRGAAAAIDLATFRAPGFAPAVVVMAMLGAAIYPLFFGLPQYYRGVAGLDAVTAGLLMVPYGIGNLVAMPLTGRLSDRIDPRVLVGAGAAGTLVAFVLLLRTGPDTPVAAFAALSLLVGLGLGAVGSPTVSSLYRVLPEALVPSGSSTLFIVNQLGGSLGVAVLTILVGGQAWTPAVGTTPLWVPLAASAAILVATTRIGGSARRPAACPA
jgi:EmrB/QacA subfamily drug resistance transporter